MIEQTSSRELSRRHNRVAAYCVLGVATMGGLAYASVPLYQLFCQVTGFGGTTQVATAPSETVVDRTITVRFDANVSRDLAWQFQPVERKVELKIGENRLTSYTAANVADHASVGTATFNVTPAAAGAYFNKIECFCFTEQKLEPGQSIDMPVSFFVDPAILDDPNAQHLTQITLSYTFYPVKEPKQSAAAAVKTGAEAGSDKPAAAASQGG